MVGEAVDLAIRGGRVVTQHGPAALDVYLHGKPIVLEGEYVGQPGDGQFLKRAAPGRCR